LLEIVLLLASASFYSSNEQLMTSPNNSYNKDFFQQIIESLEDYAIFATDTNGNISSWNSGAEKNLGYQEKEIINENASIFFTEEDKKQGKDKMELRVALEKGKALDERWHVRKNGTLFWGSGLVFPLKDQGGKLIGFTKIMRDLTQKKLEEEERQKYLMKLEQLNSHKDKLLSVISHDLRTPANGIIGAADLLKSKIEKFDKEDIKQMAEIIEISSRTLLRQLDDLVEWAQAESLKEVFNPKLLRLYNIVEDAIKIVNENAVQKNIRLENIVGEDVYVRADEKMLLSVFQNLFSNGIKYTPAGGKIITSARKNEDKILIEVCDTGIGLSEDIKRELFKPETFTTEGTQGERGFGLGLVLVKDFINRHGGDVWAESREGKGTSFLFSLPVQKI
jgi:PAS domain S-box-containing protein